jgi:DNA-binding CsgD family transcriptional regulator
MKLSPREREIADCLCSGMTLTAVATKLGISKHTARNHLKHVFGKLGVHSQNELTALMRSNTFAIGTKTVLLTP